MIGLQQRAERLARARQQREVERVARLFGELLGAHNVEALPNQVVVSGRGIMRRWLVDPALRFWGNAK
jgi:hypothetical protein